MVYEPIYHRYAKFWKPDSHHQISTDSPIKFTLLNWKQWFSDTIQTVKVKTMHVAIDTFVYDVNLRYTLQAISYQKYEMGLCNWVTPFYICNMYSFVLYKAIV